MRRAPGLVEVSRRDFCALACAGAGVVIAGCTDGLTGIETGPLKGSDDSAPDAGPIEPGVDAAVTSHDAGTTMTTDGGTTSATCGSGATDVGLPTAFALNTPTYFSSGKFFVVKDSGGYYAVTAVCTHEGATIAVSGSDFRCPRHGAIFTFNGAIVSGPVSRVLVHYAMCTLANGHLGVTTTSTVAAATRLAA